MGYSPWDPKEVTQLKRLSTHGLIRATPAGAGGHKVKGPPQLTCLYPSKGAHFISVNINWAPPVSPVLMTS